MTDAPTVIANVCNTQGMCSGLERAMVDQAVQATDTYHKGFVGQKVAFAILGVPRRHQLDPSKMSHRNAFVLYHCPFCGTYLPDVVDRYLPKLEQQPRDVPVGGPRLVTEV
jgi:hypothetical protein